MLTTKTIACCLLLTVSADLYAQTGFAGVPLQNVAQLSASGSVEVQQDMLSIAMNTSRDGVDAGSVQTQLKQALDSALAVARQAAALGQLDVRTGNFNLYPRYGKDGKINGWQGTTGLVLEGRDFARITTAAGKIQTLTLGNVSFALSREQRTRVEGEAQQQAIELFKIKAGDIARGFGFNGYTVREVSVSASDQGSVPRPRTIAMQARSEMSEAPVSVEAGKSTVLVNVNGSVQMR